MSGLFSGTDLNAAKVIGGGVYILAGDYTMEIEGLKVIRTRGKGPMFVADFKILESTCPERPAGSRCNHTVLIEKDWGPTNLKEFLVAASGLDSYSSKDGPLVDKENWNAILERSLSDEAPYVGLKIKCTATTQDKKKSEGQFTRVRFYPHPDTRSHFGIK